MMSDKSEEEISWKLVHFFLLDFLRFPSEDLEAFLSPAQHHTAESEALTCISESQ